MRPRLLAPAIALLLVAGCSGDAPPATAPARAVLAPEPGVLRLAGSGAFLPLARALGEAWQKTSAADLRVVVEDSIGSGGGVRAVVDGAADIGLVSRPLNVGESRLDLVVIPVAIDAVLIAANPDIPVAGVTTPELVSLYGGETRRFSDGSPAAVLLRDRGESANLALDLLPGMPAARERSYAVAGRLGFPVLYHDDAMIAAVALTPGALGVSSLGLLHASRIPLKILALDGRLPSVEALANHAWPLTRTLSFVMRKDRAERARPFLHFAFSDDARRITREHDYLPVPAKTASDHAP